MNTVLIGNIVSFVGCALMVCIGLIKEKKKILSAQCLQFVFLGAGNLILGAFTGFIANVVSLVRNLVFTRKESSVPLKMGFAALQLVLSAGGLSSNVITWLPVLSTVLFTWFIDLKSEIMLKTVILICQVMWLVYDFYYHNFVSMSFDILTMISTAIGIYLIVRDAKMKTK